MEFLGNSSKLMEQYPVTAHAPNFHFRTGYGEIKRCEESKRTLKIRLHGAWPGSTPH